MRPIAVEMEGVGRFRDRTRVEFAGAELCAFFGPTGSGKSTVLDAIAVALYGAVPRYESQNLIHPFMSLGASESRVAYEFELAGSTYYAVRVLRRSANGSVSTKEARLERDGIDVVSGATELSSHIEELLGLGFDQFTRAVILPQFKFSQLLHARGQERQKLIIQILGAHIYDAVGQRARERTGTLKARIDHLTGTIESLKGQTTTRERELKSWRKKLVDAEKQLAEIQGRLEPERKRLTELDGELTRIQAARRALAAVQVPEHVAGLSQRLSDEATALSRLNEELERVRGARNQTEASLGQMGSGEPRAILERHQNRDSLASRITKGETTVAEHQSTVKAHRSEADASRTRLREAESARTAAWTGAHVHALRDHLSTGDPCPVCERTIEALPEALETPPEVEAANKAYESVRGEHDKKEKALAEAERELARYEAGLESLREQKRVLDEQLSEAPPKKEVEATVRQLAELEKEQERLRKREGELERDLKAKQTSLEAVKAEESNAWKELRGLRDTLLKHGDPPEPGDELAASWRALSEWATSEEARLRGASETQEKERGEVRARIEAGEKDMEQLLGSLELKRRDQDEDPATVLSRALGSVAADIEKAAQDIVRRQEAEKEKRELRQEHARYDALRRHLGGKQFKRWLVNQVLDDLVQDASRQLYWLSQEQFSLELDADGEFAVIDHNSANERRIVRSLSGGETFLASLALALAFSESVARLSGTGAPPLECLFIDEGFGALDAESREVVTEAIEELASRGRFVGIVTHIEELAERMEVCFDVIREPPDRSRVERRVA